MLTQLTPVGLAAAVGAGIFLGASAYTHNAAWILYAIGMVAIVWLDGTASHPGRFERAKSRLGWNFWFRKRPDETL